MMKKILSIIVLIFTMLACDVKDKSIQNSTNQLIIEKTNGKTTYSNNPEIYKVSTVSIGGPYEEVSLKILPKHKDIIHLYMVSCHLKEYPSNLCNFSKLQDLAIINCDFETISPSIKNLENLKSMTISGNPYRTIRLEEIPKEIGYLTKMKHLKLEFNSISKLPSTIGNLLNLETLFLSYNKITQLPPEIGLLENLNTLYLEKNEIRSLPNEFWNLSNLETLDISENQLKTIPGDIKNLSKLSYLILNNNALEEIPEEIKYLESLQNLNLKNNKLTKVPEWVKGLQKLKFLDLRDNNISKQEIESIKSFLPKCEIPI